MEVCYINGILSEGGKNEYLYEKWVYFKVKNANGESAVVNDSITFKGTPLVSLFLIDKGAAETKDRWVVLNNMVTGNKPTQFMASEYPTFLDATWRGYSSMPYFLLSAGDGVKTVYFKVRNGYGESAVVSDIITLEVAQSVAVAHAGGDQLARRGSAFKNGDMLNLLLNKLNAVIANVEAGKHADAANQLRNDILPKMGSAENAEGDSVVWIIGRSSQQIWYQEAQDVVKALEMAW